MMIEKFKHKMFYEKHTGKHYVLWNEWIFCQILADFYLQSLHGHKIKNFFDSLIFEGPISFTVLFRNLERIIKGKKRFIQEIFYE